jgi:hypothetical protein
VEAPEPTQGTSSEVRYANKKGGLIWWNNKWACLMKVEWKMMD